jgi:hypothetical protein
MIKDKSSLSSTNKYFLSLIFTAILTGILVNEYDKWQNKKNK